MPLFVRIAFIFTYFLLAVILKKMGHYKKLIGHNQKLKITGMSNTKQDVWQTYSDIILLKGLVFYFTTLGEVYKSSPFHPVFYHKQEWLA